jgi:hypothetical protein
MHHREPARTCIESIKFQGINDPATDFVLPKNSFKRFAWDFSRSSKLSGSTTSYATNRYGEVDREPTAFRTRIPVFRSI